MYKFSITFDILDNNKLVPKSCREVSRYLVFDSKINFIQKSRWILDSFKNPIPEDSIYKEVILRKSARITFTYII